jgi:hypothetical protein
MLEVMVEHFPKRAITHGADVHWVAMLQLSVEDLGEPLEEDGIAALLGFAHRCHEQRQDLPVLRF